jgi:hypothetical protein
LLFLKTNFYTNISKEPKNIKKILNFNKKNISNHPTIDLLVEFGMQI